MMISALDGPARGTRQRLRAGPFAPTAQPDRAVLAALARMLPAALRVAGRYFLGPLVRAGVVSADTPWP
jgi:hypothetical protein